VKGMQNAIQELLLEQYKIIRIERIANEIVSRIVWLIFIALAVLSTRLSLFNMVFVAVVGFIYYFIMAQKISKLDEKEELISSTLARISPELEDVYIRYIHKESFGHHSPFRKILQHEQELWCLVLYCVSLSAVMIKLHFG
jgi:hypothetical protein